MLRFCVWFSTCAICLLSLLSGCTEGFVIDGVLSIKSELNETRNHLDDIDIKTWKAHTATTVRTKDVVNSIRRMFQKHSDAKAFIPAGHSSPEMVTNAWCKMYEILWACRFFKQNEKNKDEKVKHQVRTGKQEWRVEGMNRSFLQFISASAREPSFVRLTTISKLRQNSVGKDLVDTHRVWRSVVIAVYSICWLISIGGSPVDFQWKAVSLNPYFEGIHLCDY